MYTENTKQDFITIQKDNISIRKYARKVYNEIVIPTIQKFDGKVLNKRFITALQAAIDAYKDKSISMHPTQRDMFGDIEYRIFFRNSFQLKNGRWVYNDFELVIGFVTDNSGKIIAEKSITKSTEFVESNCKVTDYENAIKHYDKYYKMYEKLNEMAGKMYNEIPYAFRQNMHISMVGIAR